MEIPEINFNIDKIFRVCVWRDTFKKQSTEEGMKYLKKTKDELLNEERVNEFVKYTITERKFSDVQIKKLKTDVLKLLKQTKKEILNTENEKLKKSVDDIWFLRSALRDYIIETKSDISDTEIEKLRNSDRKFNSKAFFKGCRMIIND